ncbi:MAG TPA: hypothetical protein VMS93_05250 [Candidatus Saccharimonadales bacterium]|nr:hypothetical protein [Candidatus Saccharimonadales bacterium]
MSSTHSVKVDPSLPIDVSIVPHSPHVVVTRFWVRKPGGDWTKVDPDGDCQDGQPDTRHVGPLAPGSSVSYWLGIGGKPGSTYLVGVTVGQNGALLSGGTWLERGDTDDKGAAECEGQINLS